MNILTHKKIEKLLELILPDSCTDDRKEAIYDNYDELIKITHHYDTDAYTVIRKTTGDILSDAETEVWIKSKQRVRDIPIIPTTSNNIKSLNFVQDLNCDPRSLPKEIDLPKSKQIELANAMIQEIHEPINKLTDEQLIEHVKKMEVELSYCKSVLSARNIKIAERNKGVHHVEQTQRRLDKQKKRLEKEAKAPKAKLTDEQKKMKTMGLDFQDPADIAKFKSFMEMLGGVN